MDILTYRLNGMANAIDARFNAVEARALPAGGTAGQSLLKTGSADYAAAWGTLIAIGPTPPNPALTQLWVDTN